MQNEQIIFEFLLYSTILAYGSYIFKAISQDICLKDHFQICVHLYKVFQGYST